MLWRSSQHNLRGYAGFGPVASSLPEPELERWWMTLRARLNAAGRDPASPKAAPADDFGFLQMRVGDHDHAVVVRKRSVPDDLGRPYSTRAHVLIGPAGAVHGISLEVALGLTAIDWEPWLGAAEATASPRLRVLPLEAIRNAGLQTVHSVRATARSWPDPLPFANLLLQVLSAPRAASLAVPAASSPTSLICALFDVLGSAIEAPWTFATREAPGSSDLAWLVFTQGADDYHRAAPSRDPWLVGFTALLARCYRDKGLSGVEPFISDTPIRSVDDAVAWARLQQFEPGVPRNGRVMLQHAWTGELTEAEREYVRSAAEEELRDVISALPDAELAELLDTWHHVIPDGRSAEGADRVASLVLAGAVARWSAGRGGGYLEGAVTRLAAKAPGDVQRALLTMLEAKVADLRSAEPADLGWPAWRHLTDEAADFDRLVRGTTARAFGLLPPDVSLDFIGDVASSRRADQMAIARSAWDSARTRSPAGPERERMRQVLRRAEFSSNLPACADVLAGGDGQPSPPLRLADRTRVYEDILLKSPATSWAFLEDRAKLLRALVRRPGHLDNALILAVYQGAGLPRRTRGRLTLELAQRYLPDLSRFASRP
jgi:hypothetical protein